MCDVWSYVLGGGKEDIAGYVKKLVWLQIMRDFGCVAACPWTSCNGGVNKCFTWHGCGWRW